MRVALALFVTTVMALYGPATVDAQGVTSDSITLGVTSAFKGHAASLGSELYRGYMAFFNKINAQGGIGGRTITVKALDDSYDPPEAVRNTVKLVSQEKAFLLFGNVGTPTTVKVLPLLLKYQNIPVYMFGPFTGAQPQREEPYAAFCINVRASYRQETAALVDFFVEKGKRKIAVFYQNDAYGRSGQNGVVRGLEAHGMAIAGETTYTRGDTYNTDMSSQVRSFMAGGADAVISVGAYQACAAFIRDARKAGFAGPIANISFVGSEALLNLLLDQQRRDGQDYSGELFNSQVVPPFDDSSIPLVVQYREDMKNYAASLPADLRDPDYIPSEYSFASLEGYVNAVVFAKAVEMAGEDLTPVSLMGSIESMDGVDIGIGSEVVFGIGDHQGLDEVYITQARGGRWVLVE
ncbi:MAG: ABC transporter substrate-binding protein [bacterium]|nr:ABC transporter substrate-binding protein [bacterium]MDT8395172.1 ABC transporter substrate-binding protein [bacterium]